MANNIHWSIEDMKKKGLVQNATGDFVPVKSLVAKKVDKLPLLGTGCYPLDAAIAIASAVSIYDAAIKVGNKKIKNAVKSEVDGVKFDSNLEKYMYGLLKASHIEFEFQKEYLLQEKFRYGTEAIRAITLTVDFVLPTRNMIVDTKGFQTHDGKVRWKLLKLKLYREFGVNVPSIEMPATKKECDLLLNRLLYGQP